MSRHLGAWRIKGLVGISSSTHQMERPPANFSVPSTHRPSFFLQKNRIVLLKIYKDYNDDG